MASYSDAYRHIDFRKHPEQYRIGRGEQGVLIAEPYKSELLPYWKFKTKQDAEESAAKIYELFETYGKHDEFVGMDMARKFLQMGFTRARRYANHPSGRKYDADSGDVQGRLKTGKIPKRPKPRRYSAAIINVRYAMSAICSSKPSIRPEPKRPGGGCQD